MPSGYEADVVAWADEQSGLLRRLAAGERVNDGALDWANVAEEIESAGSSERYRLRSHIATVLEHLIKLRASPAVAPRNGWTISVRNARRGIARCLKTSASLGRELGGMILDETRDAREDVAAALAIYGEVPVTDIAALAFTEAEVLGDWFPGARPG